MKLLITCSVFLVSISVFAEGDGKFSEHKKMMVEGMNKQIESLQTTKSCIEAASDMPAVKKCHEVAKAEHMKMQSERIDHKIKMLEEEKKKMEEKK